MRSTNTKKSNTPRLIGTIIVLIVLICVTGVFLFNLFRTNKKADYAVSVVKENVTAVSEFNYSTVADVEKKIEEYEASRSGGGAQQTGPDYRKIFRGSVVLGDSITDGLSVYGYLGSDQVFCAIGGSVMNSSDMFAQAAAMYPKNAFFSYGMNDLGMYNGNEDLFIEQYQALLESFMETTPDTKIFINSISKPSDAKIESGGYFYKWEDYNKAIKKMCKKLDIEYIDNTSILKEHPEFYAGDGVHVSTDYYPIWLEDMMEKAGLE